MVKVIRSNRWPILVMVGLLILAAPELIAQKSKKKKKGEETTPTEEAKKEEDLIQDFAQKSISYPGLFQMYQDSSSGKAYLVVRKDQLDKEYIYFSHTIDGVLDARLIRGGYRGSNIFKISKYFDQIQIHIENTRFYYDPGTELSRASKANVNDPIVFTEKIEAYNQDKTEFLIEADDLFLSEAFQQVKPSPPAKPNPGQFSLGTLSNEKTKYLAIKNYPENTDVVVDYVFETKYPKNTGSSAVKDARSVRVKLQHTLIEIPENDYVPRRDDQRMGFFSTQITDLTSVSATPYRDVIHRWHLVKSDPTAELSDPVDPILFWIENTTPAEFREAITQGILSWNGAFEKAGFSNAVQVRQQPDDAEWDAGDIRYNVIRWVASPDPAYGGYGPSFVNPRTGQIIGADIMLEYVWVTNRLRDQSIFTSSTEPTGLGMDPNQFCSLGSQLQLEMIFGRQVMKAFDIPEPEENRMLKESLYTLALHEVGHTLGLMHNMMASNLRSMEEIHNPDITYKQGLSSSVMDYIPVNINKDLDSQGQYYETGPGPYDYWAIQYGYSPALQDPVEEEKRLNQILSQSSQREYWLGNDADDMRAPGRHIDPRAMISDHSSDPVQYSLDRIELVNKTVLKLIEKNSEPGKSYQELRNAYLVLSRDYAINLGIISRQIGGIYVDRSVSGQEGAGVPLRPVPYEAQKKAMKGLAKYGFSPNAFQAPKEVYAYLLQQRRGFDHFERNEDFQIHDRTLILQKQLLDHLMNQKVLERITDSELYGNKYILSEYITDLTNSIYQSDLNLSVNSMRQNLQVEYLRRLIAVMEPKTTYHTAAQSMALFEIRRIRKMASDSKSPDLISRAHRQNLVFQIDKALEI